MKTRFLFGIVALCCTMFVSTVHAQYTPRDCCDVAVELAEKNDQYDTLDDRIDALYGTMQLGLMFQQQILMRVPFTPEDQEAWDNISGVILNILDEIQALEAEQSSLYNQIMTLNQEFLTCHIPPVIGPTPLVPMPDPLMILSP